MSKRSVLSILVGLAGIVAIGTALSCSGGGGAPAATPTPTLAPGTISFRTQVHPILTATCTTSGCHTPGGTGPTDYTVGVAGTYALLVNQKSPGYGTELIVKAGDSGNSVLYAKVASDTPTLANGRNVVGDGRMPKGLANLSAAEINIIKTWIDQGAQNN